MELTWYGRTCVRMRSKDAVVVADAYQSVVGPTGRGITGDIVTYSHPDDTPHPQGERARCPATAATLLPSSLEEAFCLDGPGEYEVKDVLITGVRTFRDEHKGEERGRNIAFIVELDGVHVIHLGDIGHLLTEDKLTDIGPVDVACIPVGGALSRHQGGGTGGSAGRQGRRSDAGLRRRRFGRGAGQVPARDGHLRAARAAVEAVAHALIAARGSHDGRAGAARQGLGEDGRRSGAAAADQPRSRTMRPRLTTVRARRPPSQ